MLSAPLRLQAQIFNLGVQSNLIYRWNFLLRVMVSFVPLLGSVFLWNAVFAGKQAFAGYTFQSMVAYFITLILVDTLTVPNEDDFQIAEDIRDGQINALLLKPIGYRLYRFHLYAAARIVHSAFARGAAGHRDDLAGVLFPGICRGWKICRWRCWRRWARR